MRDVNRLGSLANSVRLQRESELRSEIAERRAFEQLGLDWSAVQRARRDAAQQSLDAAMARRSEPYQPSLPGMGNLTLMALRSREAMSPQEMAAAGIAGVGWQRSPAAVGQQLELDFGAPAPANNVVPLPAAVTAVPAQEAAARAVVARLAGDRLAQILGISGAAIGGGLGALLEANYAPEAIGWGY